MNGMNWPYTGFTIHSGDDWLSESVECDWWGVYCNDDNEMELWLSKSYEDRFDCSRKVFITN